MKRSRKPDHIDRWAAGLSPAQKWATLARLVEQYPTHVAKTLRKLAKRSS